MNIERIYLAPVSGGAQQSRESVSVRRGLGIEGDRYLGPPDEAGQNLTLVEAEEIERFCAEQGRAPDYALTRRNIVTRGVRLNELVGRVFTIGGVTLKGIERCEPCANLGAALASEALSAPAAVRYWVARGGLRADVLTDGTLRCGDAITPGA